ncbi:MAG TPA: hypothetical protein VF750_02885, partial [Sphingomicrobium sp.]
MTAALTATVLVRSAAAIAAKVRVKGDCDDILISFFAPLVSCGAMNRTNQKVCQSRETAKNEYGAALAADFPNQELAANPNGRLGTFTTAGASNPYVSTGRSWIDVGQACRRMARR